jgi:hypothetical protein
MQTAAPGSICRYQLVARRQQSFARRGDDAGSSGVGPGPEGGSAGVSALAAGAPTRGPETRRTFHAAAVTHALRTRGGRRACEPRAASARPRSAVVVDAELGATKFLNATESSPHTVRPAEAADPLGCAPAPARRRAGGGAGRRRRRCRSSRRPVRVEAAGAGRHRHVPSSVRRAQRRGLAEIAALLPEARRFCLAWRSALGVVVEIAVPVPGRCSRTVFQNLISMSASEGAPPVGPVVPCRPDAAGVECPRLRRCGGGSLLAPTGATALAGCRGCAALVRLALGRGNQRRGKQAGSVCMTATEAAARVRSRLVAATGGGAWVRSRDRNWRHRARWACSSQRRGAADLVAR